MAEIIDGNTLDIVKENLAKLQEIYPEAFTEGKVDPQKLLVLLGEDVDSSNEKYSFTWKGKNDCIRLAQSPSKGTLLPCKEESVDWDTTKNLYIEGDNLEVLKLLQKSYLGKVKMIYIDPPYNTGTDFVYHDDFTDNIANYKQITGQTHKSNAESAGRYHTNWLNMLYPRLKLARTLLSNDGAIFISIDDNECTNLRKICDGIFGDNNFVAQLVWEKKKKGAFLSKNYINMKEYILVYAKQNSSFNGLVGEINTAEETYPCIKTTNARGIRTIYKGTPSKYKEKNYTIQAGTRISSGNMELIYLDDLVVKDGILQEDVRIDSNWIYSQQALDEYTKLNLLYITQDNYIRRLVNDDRVKMLKDILLRVGADGKSLSYYKYDVNLNNGGWGTNEDANDELHHILNQQYIFDFSKPSRLLSKLVQSISDTSCIVLDFFSGSGTMAQSVIQLNAEDGGNRKFIMVQLPEVCAEDSEAYKAGYKNICEIGKERIRRAGKLIKEQNPNVDTGFRVFKLDTSNLIKWNNTPTDDPNEVAKRINDSLFYLQPDRTDEDFVYEIMLKLGMPLSKNVEVSTIEDKKVYGVKDGAYSILICLEYNVNFELVEKMAESEYDVLIFADRCFADANMLINTEEILKKKGKTLKLF